MKSLSYFLLVLLSLIQCCQRDKQINASIKLCVEETRIDTIHYVCIEIRNNSDHNLFLNNFNYINYLKIYDKNGNDFLRDFLIEKHEKLVEDLAKKYGNKIPLLFEKDTYDNIIIRNNIQPLIDIAIKKDFERVIKLNRNLNFDTVFIKAINRSLYNKYKDAIFIKSNEIFKEKIDISVLVKPNRRFTIYVDYPQERIPRIARGFLYIDNILDGRKGKVFLKYPSKNIDEIDGYISLKGKLKSNKLEIK
ncbi:MAG: hypothetical protein LLG13_04525 [Bacteroidales bacterium]|nr:hypothetical protein [Bacteroidales bacterium]